HRARDARNVFHRRLDVGDRVGEELALAVRLGIFEHDVRLARGLERRLTRHHAEGTGAGGAARYARIAGAAAITPAHAAGSATAGAANAATTTTADPRRTGRRWRAGNAGAAAGHDRRAPCSTAARAGA